MPQGTTLPTYALWLQLQYQQLLSKLPGADPVASTYPVNTSLQLSATGTQHSPTMGISASYPDASASFMHSPDTSDMTQYGTSGSDLLGTSPDYSVPAPVSSQSSPSHWNDSSLGNLAASQLAASRVAGYNSSFQGKSPFDVYNQSSVSSVLPLNCVAGLNHSQGSLTTDQNQNAAWGVNYGFSDPYLGMFHLKPLNAIMLPKFALSS